MRIAVTGATGGIGRELCAELMRRGHDVWGISRSAGNDEGMRVSRVDMADPASLLAWKEEMHAQDWLPDAIVLLAALQEEDMTPNGYDAAAANRMLRVNVEAPLACVELFLPDFTARGRGRFVAICSTAALRPSRRSAAYGASKAALAMAFRSLRLRYATHGLTFGNVFLGPVDAGMWEGKHHPLVPSAKRAASALATFACGKGDSLYFPRLSTVLLRLSLWLPDRAFAAASRLLLHP